MTVKAINQQLTEHRIKINRYLIFSPTNCIIKFHKYVYINLNCKHLINKCSLVLRSNKLTSTRNTKRYLNRYFKLGIHRSGYLTII